jgi:hypothetical protein
VEDEPIAWSKANALISLLNTRLFGTTKYEDFQQFLRDITAPHLNAIGYEPIDFEASVTTSLRSSTKSWNCLALDDACLTNEYNKFLQFYNTGSGASFDYCHALRNLNADTYQAIVTGVTTNADYPSRTNDLINLGCSLNEDNLKRLLDVTISTNILTSTERQNIFTNTMGRSAQALDAVIEFIDGNYAAINTRINSLADVLKSLAPLLNTNENIAQFDSLIDKIVLNGITLDVAEIKALYLDGVIWHTNHFQAIIDWFNPDEDTTTAATTTVTDAPTDPPTTQPTQSTDAPSSAPTTAFLSFGIAVVCLVLNL